MKYLVIIFLSIILFSCEKDTDVPASTYPTPATNSSGRSNNQQAESGVITAGEWNDLEHWDFWNGMMLGTEYSQTKEYWEFYPHSRISVIVKDLNNAPIINATVELVEKNYDNVYWTAISDNSGKAELWLELNDSYNYTDLSDLELKINGKEIQQDLTLIGEGVNEVVVDQTSENNNTIELSFIVDATGSMGDELEFLKEDLKAVINNVENSNSGLSILTSSVFYRDHNEEYLTKKSDLTADINATLTFINEQSASGGGDTPEAVEIALSTAINELQWSKAAKTRIAFLLLDAPPHYTYDIRNQIHNSVINAAKLGIKIIPITASGTDIETEFLMRFMAMATNGTYVFITDDSGVGDSHLQASVGDYQTEKLNELLVRLISKYAE